MRTKLVYLFLLIIATSCVSNKELIYLQDGKLSEGVPTSIETKSFVYKIQPSDVLSINVQSIQPEITNIFNINTNQNIRGNSDPGTLYLSGYVVDEQGFITLPTVGKIRVIDLSVTDAQQSIQRRVDLYIKNANVVVKLTSFRITVLGDVRSPGQYYVFSGKANILEALALAGDLAESGDRRKVKLIRQTSKGSEVILLDLTDPDLMRSEYFYMLPNDAIYIQPMQAYTKRNNLTLLGVVFSGITTVVLLYNTFK